MCKCSNVRIGCANVQMCNKIRHTMPVVGVFTTHQRLLPLHFIRTFADPHIRTSISSPASSAEPKGAKQAPGDNAGSCSSHLLHYRIIQNLLKG